MSSAAAGPNSIRIPVVMDLDTATGQLRTFRRVAAVETGAAAKDMGVAITGAEATTAKAAVGMTESIGKIRPLMGTITRGLGAMGIEGAGAFSSLTRGAITLANTGFTPLGIGIAASVALLGVFAKSARDTEEATKGLREEIDRLGQSNAELALRGEAKRTGTPFDELDTTRKIEEANDAIRGSKIAISIALARQMDLELQYGSYVTMNLVTQKEYRREVEIVNESLRQITDQERNVAGLERRLSLLRSESDQWREILATIQRAQAYDRSQVSPGFVDAARKRLGVGDFNAEHDRLQMPDPYAGFKPSPGLVADETTREVAALAAAERQRRAAENAGILSDFEANRAAEAATRESRDAVMQGNAARYAESLAEAQKQAMQATARDAEAFRGFGEAGAASITLALNHSIESGDFRSFFAQFQAGMADAVVSAFTYALIQKPLASALGDITGNIGGLFGYGRGGASPTTAANSGTMETFMANGGGVAPKSVMMNFPDGTSFHIKGGKGGGVPRGKAARWAT